MITETDTINAIRARLEKKKGELESEIVSLQQELQEIEDTLGSLERVPKLLVKYEKQLENRTIPNTITTNETLLNKTSPLQRGISEKVKEILRDMPGDDGDPIVISYIAKQLKKCSLRTSNRYIYSILRKEAEIKTSSLIYVAKQGFFLVRS